MITLLLTILVWAIILGVLYWGLHRIWQLFGLPPLILGLIDILLVVFAVYVILRTFGLLGRATI